VNEVLRAQLLSLARRDQRLRAEWAERPNDRRLRRRVTEADAESTERLRHVVGEFGWPGLSMVGEEAAQAAWLLVQHSPDDAFMRECLELLRRAVERADAPPWQLAYLEDRVRLQDGREQLYGTQLWSPTGGRPVEPWPIEDVEGLDRRRSAVGLGPFDEYLRQMAEQDPGAP
jgi:hypothetical protein